MEKIEELEAIYGLPQLEIHFTTGEELSPPLEDVGLFLFDLTVVFELHVANSLNEPLGSITRFSLYRNHSRVTAEQCLRVQRVSLASPAGDYCGHRRKHCRRCYRYLVRRPGGRTSSNASFEQGEDAR